jgi:hypothetical protein
MKTENLTTIIKEYFVGFDPESYNLGRSVGGEVERPIVRTDDFTIIGKVESEKEIFIRRIKGRLLPKPAEDATWQTYGKTLLEEYNKSLNEAEIGAKIYLQDEQCFSLPDRTRDICYVVKPDSKEQFLKDEDVEPAFGAVLEVSNVLKETIGIEMRRIEKIGVLAAKNM